MAGWRRVLVPQLADDHHAFHEDAKPGDLLCGPMSDLCPHVASANFRHRPRFEVEKEVEL